MIRFWREHQELRFLVAGGYNTLFGYCLFAGAVLLLPQINYLILLVIATVFAVLNAFFVYRWFVFDAEPGFWLRDLGRFSLSYVGLLAVNLVLLPLLVQVGGLPILLAQAIVLVVTVVSGFFTHRNYSFRKSAAAD